MKRTFACLLLMTLAGCEAGSKSSGQAGREPASAAQLPAVSGTLEAAESKSADDVRLRIVSYQEILDLIAQNRGKVVVMDAWSTSCAPCMKEFPNLVKLHNKYGRDELACVSLSFDYEGLGKPEEQQDRVLDFLRAQRATFDNLLSNEESDVLYRKFDLAAVPAVFVYDRSGALRKRFDNQKAKSKDEHFTYQQVGELVAELLKEPKAQ
jgi:thiol-disulfide isomerase/thioredoxin